MLMWVIDGNVDVDYVSVNGNIVYCVIDWRKLFGIFFVFYRKCLFKYNILSFDI